MGTEVEGKRRTSNWNIVITILHCCIVDVERIHIHSTLAVVVHVALRLTLVLLRFLDATVTVLHLKELKLAKDRSTIIAFNKVFLLRISGPDIMWLPVVTRYIYAIDRHNEKAGLYLWNGCHSFINTNSSSENPETATVTLETLTCSHKYMI